MKKIFFSMIAIVAMMFVNPIFSSAQSKKELSEENTSLKNDNTALVLQLEEAREEAKDALKNATWEDTNMTVDIYKGTDKGTYWGPGVVNRNGDDGTYVRVNVAKANESDGFCGGSSAKADAGSKPAKVADNTKAQTTTTKVTTNSNTAPVVTASHKKVKNTTKVTGQFPSIKQVQHYFLDHTKEAKQFAAHVGITVTEVTAWLEKAKVDTTVCGGFVTAIYCNKCDELEWDTVSFNGVPCILDVTTGKPVYRLDLGQLVGVKVGDTTLSPKELDQIADTQEKQVEVNGPNWMNSRPADNIKAAAINPLFGLMLFISACIFFFRKKIF